MRRLNLNLRLPLAFALAALLCGASLSATAQTTTTLTPAQKAAAAAQAQAAARAKAQAAAQARAQAAAAAKAKATPTTTVAQSTAATTQGNTPTVAPPVNAKPTTMFTPVQPAKPVTMFTPSQPAATNTAATTTAPAVTAPATAAKPSCGGFFNPCSPTSNGGGTSGGGPSVGPDSANRTSGTDGFASGQGRFDYYDHSIVAYGCLRSGTRVFCDFDQFKQNPAQVNAQSAFSGTKLVMSGGRIFSTARSTFVDTDGSTYPTAQMSPTTGVRLMLEYDDVPDTQSVAILSFNNKEIQNVAITPMNLQANGNPAPRSAPGGQQTASAPAPGQAPAAAAPQGVADRANNAATAVQNQRSKWGAVLGNIKNATAKQPQ